MGCLGSHEAIFLLCVSAGSTEKGPRGQPGAFDAVRNVLFQYSQARIVNSSVWIPRPAFDRRVPIADASPGLNR